MYSWIETREKTTIVVTSTLRSILGVRFKLEVEEGKTKTRGVDGIN